MSDPTLKKWVEDRLMQLMGYSNALVSQFVIRLGIFSSLLLYAYHISISLLCYLLIPFLSFPFHASAKEASSPDDLSHKLLDYVPCSSNDLRTFASGLYQKIPHKHSTLSVRLPSPFPSSILPSSTSSQLTHCLILFPSAQAYQKDERDAANLVRKQMTYKLLDADDADADEPPNLTSNSTKDKLSSSSSSTKKRFRKKTHAQDATSDDDVSCIIISFFLLS